MIKQTEFKIKSRPELEFRVGKISAIDMLALQIQTNFEDMKQTKEVFTFILEHIEVKLLEKWVNVKVQGREIYMPENLEEDLRALQELYTYFLVNILKPLFVKSEESSQKQQ